MNTAPANLLHPKAVGTLLIATWNVNWASAAGWPARREFLDDIGADVMCLQEVRGDLAGTLGDTAQWAVTTSPFVEDCWRKRNALVVGVAGTSATRPKRENVLTVNDFPEVPDWLAARFAARAIAVDIEWRGMDLRVGSFRASPGSSSGVGAFKPWFHTRIGEWVATWSGPWLFGVPILTLATTAT